MTLVAGCSVISGCLEVGSGVTAAMLTAALANNGSQVRINGAFRVTNNDLLFDLTALSNVRDGSMTAGIFIENSNRFTSLNGLQNKVLSLSSGLLIRNTSLLNLTPLNGATYIGGKVTIDGNSQLASVDLFNIRQATSPSFFITSNPALRYLRLLSNTSDQVGDVVVYDNANLETFTGFNTTIQLNSWSVVANPRLTLITGFNEATYAFCVDPPYVAGEQFCIRLEDAACSFPNIFNRPSGFAVVNTGSVRITRSGMRYFGSVPAAFQNQAVGIQPNFVLWHNYDLTIDSNPELTHIFPGVMTGVQSGGWGHITITRNPKLVAMDGFNHVTYAAGYITITSNPLLTDLGGFAVLAGTTGGLTIANNERLVRISGFTVLENSGRLQLENLMAVQTWNFTRIAGMNGGLLLRNISMVDGEAVFARVWYLAGDLTVTDCPHLTRFTFGTVQSFSSYPFITFRRNPSLVSIRITTDVSANHYIGHVWIRDNPVLQSFVGFNATASLNTLLIANNPQLSTISAFHRMQYAQCSPLVDDIPTVTPTGLEVQACIRIQDDICQYPLIFNDYATGLVPNGVGAVVITNSGLRYFGVNNYNFAGLSGGHLMIQHNPNLLGFGPLPNMGGWGGSTTITHNPSLQDISGFVALTGFGGWLSITHNPSMLDISGFNAMTSTGGGFNITDNDSLLGISGFRALNSMTYSFYLTANRALKEITGFQNFAYTGGFWVFNNENLVNLTMSYSGGSLGPNIFGNPRLKYIEFKRSLSNGGFVWFHDMPQLTHIIFPGMSMSGSFIAQNLPALTNIEITGPSSFGGSWLTENLPALTTLYVTGTLSFSGTFTVRNTGVPNLDGLSGMTMGGESYEVSGNPLMTSLTGFDPLSLGNVDILISNNQRLGRIAGYRTSGARSLTIKDCPALTEIVGFYETTSLTGTTLDVALTLENLPELSSVNFTKLATIRGAVIRNTGLTDLTGFPAVDVMLTPASAAPLLITIEYNQRLTTLFAGPNFLSGISVMQQATISVSHNPALIDIQFSDESQGPTMYVRDFTVRNNSELTTMYGFYSVSSAVNSFWVAANPSKC